jgi:CDP-diacylglycerol--glycerol-3-phosphate 3-phosphatidyltransferase
LSSAPSGANGTGDAASAGRPGTSDQQAAGAAEAVLGQPASTELPRPDPPPPDPPVAEMPPPPRLLNIANALTVLRLVLVPVFVWFLLEGGTEDRAIAFVAFALASVTDLLDGELARRRSLITDFGKIADPIADKALTGSALITLSCLGELAWWITAVIVVRELAVTGLRFWVIRHGVIAASRGGKAKTMLQIIAISLYILPWHIPLARETVMGVALVVTVVTGIDYTARAIRLRRAVQ